MIYDNINNLDRYQNDSKLYDALVALQECVCGQLYDKKDVEGFNLQKCNTISLQDAKLENHHEFIDIHYVIQGVEMILVNSSKNLERLSNYSEESDCELFALSGNETCIKLQEGDFLVVYPGECHAPKVAVNDETTTISKIVVKLK